MLPHLEEKASPYILLVGEPLSLGVFDVSLHQLPPTKNGDDVRPRSRLLAPLLTRCPPTRRDDIHVKPRGWSLYNVCPPFLSQDMMYVNFWTSGMTPWLAKQQTKRKRYWVCCWVVLLLIVVLGATAGGVLAYMRASRA